MDAVTDPVVLLTDDPGLHAEVARLAAAANVTVEVGTLDGAAESWRTGAAVLVGTDLAESVAARVAGRREDVYVVETGKAGEDTLRTALALGAAGVVELPGEAPRLGAWLADLGDRATAAPAGGRVLGVLGASGGVGATVLALALTEVAAQESPAVLVDLDPWGLPAGVLAGVSTHDGDEPITWADLAGLEGRVGARALRESLPARDGVRVLGWAPGAQVAAPSTRVVREVVTAARRGHGWVVLDVPRSGATREVLTLCDAVVVVATPSLAGTAGAARVGGLVPAGGAAGVVVRTARGAWPEDVARLAGLPLWGTLGSQPGLDEHLAAGLGAVRPRRSPCARAARQVLAVIASGSLR
jgi:secretion/DNA translocation related CpaE-like protein